MNPAHVYPAKLTGPHRVVAEGIAFNLDPSEDELTEVTALRARHEGEQLLVELYVSGKRSNQGLRLVGVYPATWDVDDWSIVECAVGEVLACVVGPGGEPRLYLRLSPLVQKLGNAGAAVDGEGSAEELVARADEAARRADPRAYAALAACARMLEAGAEDAPEVPHEPH